jgi:hypothetical protein
LVDWEYITIKLASVWEQPPREKQERGIYIVKFTKIQDKIV